MLCDKCGQDMKVTGYHYLVEGDGELKKLYIVQKFICRNKNCSNHENETTIKTEQDFLTE